MLSDKEKIFLSVVENYHVPHYFHVDAEKKLVLFDIPQNGSDVVLAALPKSIAVNSLERQQLDFKKITFVRNPFCRLYACYKNKFRTGSMYTEEKCVRKRMRLRSRSRHLSVSLGNMATFQLFVELACSIPDKYAHFDFTSQSFYIDTYRKYRYDFIGKIENLAEDFKIVCQQYDLVESPPTASADSLGDWAEHYNQELADLVYRRYEKDFKKWYPDEYSKLLQRLKTC